MGIGLKNHEGYRDDTAHDALTQIEKDERLAAKKAAYRPLIYVCSPYAGNVKRNVERAKKYARFVIEQGKLAVCMHLMLPQYLDDSNPNERATAMFINMVILGKCDELWIFGDVISSGMEQEIERAKKQHKVICYFSDDCEEVELND